MESLPPDVGPVTHVTNWPMVGREDELRWASEVVARPGHSVVLAGVAGVGKSRLAGAIAGDLEMETTVRRVTATAASSAIPFGAFEPLLWEEDHAHLGHGRPIDSGNAVLAALGAGADPSSVVLIVDDAHQLDASSASLVRQLAGDGRTRLLLTIRTGELVPDDITAVWKDLGAVRFELQALSELETAAVLGEVLAGPVQPHAAAKIFECSGGNPLYLREVVLRALATEVLVEHRGAWRLAGELDTGPRLQELVQQRLDGLARPTMELLRVVSFGEPLPLSLVETLGAFDALVEAEDRGLVTTSTGHEPDVRMAHPVYREVVRSSAGVAARRQVHSRLHAVANDSIDSIRRVLWWQQSSKRDGIPMDLVLRAAALARREAAPNLALQLLDGVEATADVALARGHALFVCGREHEAIEQFGRAVSLADDDHQRSEAYAAHINALVYGFDDLRGARDLLDLAEQTITDDRAIDFVRSQYVSFVTLAGQEADSELVDRLIEHDDPRVRLRAFPAGSQSLLRQGRVDDAVTFAAAHVQPALELTNELPDALGWVFSALTTNQLMAGNLDEVENLLAMARGMGTAPGTQTIALVDLIEGRLHAFRGRMRTASEYLRRCLVVMEEELPNSSYTTWALSLQAECAALLGDIEAANKTSQEAERRETFEVAMIALDARRARAWVAAAGLDRVGAARSLAELAARCEAEHHPLVELQVLFDACRLGAPQACADRLLELAPTLQGQWASIFRRHIEARQAGDAPELEAVAHDHESRGLSLYAVDALMDAVKIQTDAGRTTDARRTRARAERIAQRCEGVRPVSFQSTIDVEIADLTARELEIAQLAVRGLSSREIAEHLVVSRRTVDNQLGRIYVKLGIAGRHELSGALDGGRDDRSAGPMELSETDRET